MTDQIQRFIFEHADVRGEIVRLDESFKQAVEKHAYTPAVRRWLGDFLSAAVLLSQTIKFEGTLILQARSEGEVPLIMAEASSNGQTRAIAKEADEAFSDDFRTAFKEGYLSITIDPVKGKRYQGIVALDGGSLAECLEQYFTQSEQLSTRIQLACDGQIAGGFLLQELPAGEIKDADERVNYWQHVTHLANTLSEQELLSLEFETLLHRLYHEETVQLFVPTEIRFQCSCSEQRTMAAIRVLGREDAEQLIAERGEISIQCEFCHHDYRFGADSLNKIFDVSIH